MTYLLPLYCESDLSMRILLVEDDNDTAVSVQRELQAEGFTVFLTDLGEEAVDLEMYHRFDFILLDLELPDLSGFEVLRRIRAAGNSVPFMIVSGFPGSKVVRMCLAGGADDYLRKPFYLDELVARINAITRRVILQDERKSNGKPVVNAENRKLNVGGTDKEKDENDDVAARDGESKLSLQTKGVPIFLCHNSQDKPLVRRLARQLRRAGVMVWFDEWNLLPGARWVEALEQEVENIRGALVLIGSNGLGPWQDIETKSFLEEFVRRSAIIIPVLLPGATDLPKLPIFLRGFSWLDLRRGFRKEKMERLIRLLGD